MSQSGLENKKVLLAFYCTFNFPLHQLKYLYKVGFRCEARGFENIYVICIVTINEKALTKLEQNEKQEA